MPAVTRRASVLTPPSSDADYDTPPAHSKLFVAGTPTPKQATTQTISPSATPKHGRREVQPLCPAKLVVGLSQHRPRVSFSPQLASTKLFRSTDPLLSDPPSDPPSSSTGYDSPSSCSHRSASPSLRGILKRNASQILVAKTAQEGTWNNRETARRIVAGTKPGAFYSTMVLASMDGVDDIARSSSPDDESSSDDHVQNGSEDLPSNVPGSGGSEEEEEEVECLHPASLISVILNGAEDLLTLEEAYTALCLRLRDTMTPPNDDEARFKAVWQPVAHESSAVVRAVQRDLSRLMGRVPQSEFDPSSSPFRNVASNRGLPPSPTRALKQGYTEYEVRYRREAAGVGSAVLRLLGVIFSHPRLFHAFTQADVQSLLTQVIIIMSAPSLPTPLAKRTYTMTMAVLAQLNLPAEWIKPLRKLPEALEKGMTFNRVGIIKDPLVIRKEAFKATAKLLRRYPRIMFPEYKTLLPPCLAALMQPNLRRFATAAIAMFVNAKLQLLEETFEWNTTRNTVSNCETFAAKWLESPARDARGKTVVINGERQTELLRITSTFEAVVSQRQNVIWLFNTWAVLVSLTGKSYKALDKALAKYIAVPSATVVRPTFGIAAWLHSVHAYFVANSTSFVNHSQVVRSYNPFVASASQMGQSRINAILKPIMVALDQAHDSEQFTTAIVTDSDRTKRCTWQRAEATKKQQWMVTAGMSARSIVYAYTVVALSHHEPSSSDGDMPETRHSDKRFAMLEETNEKILRPVLERMFSVRGVDELLVTSWEILAAVTAASPGVVPSLNRLLSTRYLDADLVDEPTPENVLVKFSQDSIPSEDIPGWGKVWVASRLGKVLPLFQMAIGGMRGINTVKNDDWVLDERVPLLPRLLSTVWRNALEAVAYSGTPAAVTPVYNVGVHCVVRTILEIFDKDPVDYVPVGLLNPEGQLDNPDVIRLGITLHLFNVAREVLGDAALGDKGIPKQEHPDTDIAQGPHGDEPITTDSAHAPSAVGHILGRLLAYYKDSVSPMDPAVSRLFASLVSSLLEAGCPPGRRTALLGTLTRMVPHLFTECEHLRLVLWRLLASKWSEVLDLQPSQTVNNSTGELLTGLLAEPFRSSDPESPWYTAASSDLDLWDALLSVTVRRFRSRGRPVNSGVLGTLAGQLGKFVPVDDDYETRCRRGSDTTLHCLAKAVASIAEPNPSAAEHVPAIFLGSVSDALVSAYMAETVPSKVTEMVENLATFLGTVPNDAVQPVIEALRGGLAMWMSDADKRVAGDLVDKLDAMYVAILGGITRAIESGSITASADTMDAYIELYAPRLSLANSESVPKAFQEMWCRAFQPLGAVEYSYDVATFLRDVLTAVPGLIIAEGLSTLESSESVYPHADEVPKLQQPQQVEDEEMDVVEDLASSDDLAEGNVDDSTHYDADVSETPSKRPRISNDEIVPSTPAEADTDVFGPKRAGSARRPRKSRARGSASTSSSPGPANTTVIPDTPMQETSPAEPQSLVGRVLGKISNVRNSSTASISGESARSEASSSVAEDTPTSSRSGRKRRRPRTAEAEAPAIVVEAPPTQVPTSAQPPPRTRNTRRSTQSRSVTPMLAPESPPSSPMTRSATRKRESRDESPSQGRSKRPRRTRSGVADDDDELRLSPASAARMQREEREAIAQQATTSRSRGSRARANATEEKKQREREERERVEREERERVEREERERVEREERERVEREERERVAHEEKEREEKRREEERQAKEREEQERREKEAEQARQEQEQREEAERQEQERLKNERQQKAREERERVAREAKERKERAARARSEERRRMEEERAREEVPATPAVNKGKGRQQAPVAPEPAPEPEQTTPEVSGRFDDAPGDITPVPTPPSPRRAPATPPNEGGPLQLSGMLALAEQWRQTIANLDKDGIVDFMSNFRRFKGRVQDAVDDRCLELTRK